MKIGKKYFFSRNQKKILLLQKWNKTHLAVLLGYETIIWHHQSQNLGFSQVLILAHCDFSFFGVDITGSKGGNYNPTKQEQSVL